MKSLKNEPINIINWWEKKPSEWIGHWFRRLPQGTFVKVKSVKGFWVYVKEITFEPKDELQSTNKTDKWHYKTFKKHHLLYYYD